MPSTNEIVRSIQDHQGRTIDDSTAECERRLKYRQSRDAWTQREAPLSLSNTSETDIRWVRLGVVVKANVVSKYKSIHVTCNPQSSTSTTTRSSEINYSLDLIQLL